jgi:Cu+-exporting ATPase
VSELKPAPGVTADQLLALAASVERESEHPLAGAIVRAAAARGLAATPPDDFTAVSGRGLVAVVGGQVVVAGTPAFLAEQGVDMGPIEPERATLEAAAQTVIGVARAGAPAGWIALRDELKPGAREALGALAADGLELWMITGDNPRTAHAIAQQAGLPADHVLASVLPEEKAGRIRELQARGVGVAMVGDGLNDAPALAQADLGIAMGSGTDVAMESADIVLMRNDLAGVATALMLSRAVMRTIKQNLFWAFGYNVLGIPVAAGVLYAFGGPLLSPMLAAAAMSMSSVSVLTNALRLKRFRASH